MKLLQANTNPNGYKKGGFPNWAKEWEYHRSTHMAWEVVHFDPSCSAPSMVLDSKC